MPVIWHIVLKFKRCFTRSWPQKQDKRASIKDVPFKIRTFWPPLSPLWRHCYYKGCFTLSPLGWLPLPPDLGRPFWMAPKLKTNHTSGFLGSQFQTLNSNSSKNNGWPNYVAILYDASQFLPSLLCRISTEVDAFHEASSAFYVLTMFIWHTNFPVFF